MTLARDSSEARALERSLRVLSKPVRPIYVGEGGSDPSFVDRIKRLPNVHVCAIEDGREPTLVNQLHSAFSGARRSGAAWLLYTEPDKRAFFAKGLDSLAEAGLNSDSGHGLILAARAPRAFATFPEGQRIAETLMNRICGEALGQEGDYTYGPMLINGQLLNYMHLIPENLAWGWRFFLMAIAHQLRMSVTLRKVGSPCPPGQRDEDDAMSRAYRLRQLTQNVTGLANGWTCLLDEQAAPPNSRLSTAGRKV